VKRTRVPVQKGGYVIYGVAHQHSGGTGSSLYGKVMLNTAVILVKLGISNSFFSPFMVCLQIENYSCKRVFNNDYSCKSLSI